MNVKEFAPQLAALLSSCWTVSQAHDLNFTTGTLVNGPARLHLSTNRDRLNVSAYFDHDLYKHRSYNAQHHSISMSVLKTAENIAKDINRRLLPEYESELTLLVERKRTSELYEINKRLTYLKALRFVGKETDRVSIDTHTYVGPANFTLEANNETTVELNRFQVTPAQLLRIKEVAPELFAEAQS